MKVQVPGHKLVKDFIENHRRRMPQQFVCDKLGGKVVLEVGVVVMRSIGLVVITLLLAGADTPDTEIARVHFERGKDRYAAGDYVGALKEFQAARKVHPAPALDYNIARCFDRLELQADAITAYQQYLLSEENPPDADIVRQRIEILKTRVAPARAPSPASVVLPPPPPPPPEGDRGHTLRIAGITVGAIGLACLVGGIATGVLAQQAGDELSRLDQTRPRVQFDPGKEDAGKTDQVLEGVFLGIGAAAVVTATVLYAVGRRAARTPLSARGGSLCVHF
jgi:hypothetical protein